MSKDTKKLVMVVYTNSSGSDFTDLYFAINSRSATELANNLLLSFEKEEGTENIVYRWGSVKSGEKGMTTDKHTINITITGADIPVVKSSRVGAPHKDGWGNTVYGIEFDTE